MDPYALVADLELATAGLGRAAGELALTSVRLARAAAQVVWTGHAADVAMGALAADVIATAACAAAADHAARGLQSAASDARALATALGAWP